MIATSVKFKGHRCFKSHWAGFDEFKPINVIIGRNNTGKSHLIDLVEFLTKHQFRDHPKWDFKCQGTLDEGSLQQAFQPNTSDGDLRGNHWIAHGELFISQPVEWETLGPKVVDKLELRGAHNIDVGLQTFPQTKELDRAVTARKHRLSQICLDAQTLISSKIFLRLRAERDITPEPKNISLDLDDQGRGATNIIRRHITSAVPTIQRSLIADDLLSALNHIFKGDGEFIGIDIQEHEEGTDENRFLGKWEVVLIEKKKGRIALSRSGSGLKTVLLVLLNLIAVPSFSNAQGDQCVFAFEELENNLHPSLLRRLLRYIETYVLREKSMVFLTTHSSVALDLFGPVPHAQIIRVSNDGESAQTTTVTAHFEKQSLISELGVKPSDLLHANGIVWVEGPSDRIYLNQWIELASGGKLREGRDYQCAFYGGSLLAQVQFTPPGDAPDELTNLLRLNSNIIMICDSDRTANDGEGSVLKDRVTRIAEEVGKIPLSHLWITEAKEIENYLPDEAVRKAGGVYAQGAPGQYEYFFPSKSAGDNGSYWEKMFSRTSYDKVELASVTAPFMTKENMATRFDWRKKIDEIVACINRWNA